jgi:hypothetical protein
MRWARDFWIFGFFFSLLRPKSKIENGYFFAKNFTRCLGCVYFTKKILGFGPLFYKMKLNTMQIFWQKGIHSSFWILASRGKKKTKKPSPTPRKI